MTASSTLGGISNLTLTKASFAKSFGGGGHAFASGAVVNKSLDKAKNYIVNNCEKMLKEQIKAIK